MSNTELSGFFCPHRVPGRELSEVLSVDYLCAKANSPSFRQNLPSLPQNSVRLSSLFRNSILETVFRPFPIFPSSRPCFFMCFLCSVGVPARIQHAQSLDCTEESELPPPGLQLQPQPVKTLTTKERKKSRSERTNSEPIFGKGMRRSTFQ